MLEGLYSVKFNSNMGSWGAGVALFTNGKVYGGDASYYYMGTANVEGENVSARIHVGHHQGERMSIFGSLNEFNLEVSGTPSGDSFSLSGHVVEQPNMKITISGRKISAI
jgi:hypothetical protein